MGIFSQNAFRGRALCSQLLFSVLLAAFLVGCGDDSSSGPDRSSFNSELSNANEVSSSSNADSKQRSSSSSVKDGGSTVEVSSSSSLKEIEPPEEGLDIVYVLVDGTASGVIALDEFSKGAQVEMIQLNSEDGYARTKVSFSGDVDKDGAYEIK